MKRRFTYSILFIVFILVLISFKETGKSDVYRSNYYTHFDEFKTQQIKLLALIKSSDITAEADIEKIRQEINITRRSMKGMDFWMRYLEPTIYKRINGPLPVEWETEVFEKFEKPYKREGTGLTLAALYLDEENPDKDSLAKLIEYSIIAFDAYRADSIVSELDAPGHFFFCNRLYLLNLAAIYTTGFECPDPEQVIPELQQMMADVRNTYNAFNESYPNTLVTEEYLHLYDKTMLFVAQQPKDYNEFDHFSFIKDYINPLFALNQQLVLNYKLATRSMVDYSLNKQSTSIFSKTLYRGQNPKGVYLRVRDEAALAEIDRLGKLLFYDPILSGNNMRSCASCHKPTEYFTDTLTPTSFKFDHKGFLARNTPSLLNAQYNHLIMADGKYITLQDQTKAVITDANEMGATEQEIMKKVLSCNEYKTAFTKLLQYTPEAPELTFGHITSAITYYYSKFSQGTAPFDDAMNNIASVDASVKEGFNIFMSKAQCATCHFAPQFNGVKPPYIGSEFEVLGVPADTGYQMLDKDKGRYEVNPAKETMNAFRTGTVRNAAYTKPYMHNGVFNTLDEVIEFYNTGGGAGHGLAVHNQTLSADSLHLTAIEKNKLISFIASLNEKVTFEQPPASLPLSKIKTLKTRKVGGEY
jgi:Cytochrome c peroxidase